VEGFGDAAAVQTQPMSPSALVALASARSGRGYWLAASNGAVYSFGDAQFRGGLVGKRLTSPIVGMAAGGAGYWFVASDGGVFAFDAPYDGSAAGLATTARVVAMSHD